MRIFERRSLLEGGAEQVARAVVIPTLAVIDTESAYKVAVSFW